MDILQKGKPHFIAEHSVHVSTLKSIMVTKYMYRLNLFINKVLWCNILIWSVNRMILFCFTHWWNLVTK